MFFCSLYGKEIIENLSQNPQWLALLHINENNISEISDSNFYISKQLNPKIELETLLQEKSCENICKYPARYKFLSDNLDLNISFSHCKDLQTFLKDSRGESVSLVFASSFLGSPTSYFGHTFIKINKQKNIYFSQTLSYAAEMPQNVGFADLLVKGIGGGFTGKYVASPYFKLIEGYNIVEQRTLYDYELDLTKDEIETMLWHSYEMLNTNIPYKFFTENCAYEIFWLLDVARPNGHLREKLKTYVIPYETIETVKKINMVKNFSIREPLIEKLYTIYNSLSSEEKEFFAIWKESETKEKDLNNTQFSQQSKNKLSELINGHYDILFKKFRTSKADFYDVKKIPFQRTVIEKNDDFEPKKSHKISFGTIKKDNESGQILNFRPVLFDRFEERDNKLSESTLEFLNIGVSKIDNNTKLENFDIVKMESLNKRFDFYTPISWRFYVGANRSFETDNLEAVLELGMGLTKGNEFVSVYGIGQVALYPFVTSANFQALGGVSFWLDKLHINFDYKETFKDGMKPKDAQKLSLFYPINTSFNLKLSNELKQKEKIIALEYRF
jgi:hypothetical protein